MWLLRVSRVEGRVELESEEGLWMKRQNKNGSTKWIKQESLRSETKLFKTLLKTFPPNFMNKPLNQSCETPAASLTHLWSLSTLTSISVDSALFAIHLREVYFKVLRFLLFHQLTEGVLFFHFHQLYEWVLLFRFHRLDEQLTSWWNDP